jgi:hypothetical protein
MISIVGILVGMLLPAVQSARESARRTTCSNKLKQLGIALSGYHDSRKAFPVGHEYDPSNSDSATGPKNGWMNAIVRLLPFNEDTAYFNDLMSTPYRPWFWEPTAQAAWPGSLRVGLPNLLCPSDGRGGMTKAGGFGIPLPISNYLPVFQGENWVEAGGAIIGQGDLGELPAERRGVFFWPLSSRKRGAAVKDITDGLSKTMVFSEHLTAPASRDSWRGIFFFPRGGAAFVLASGTPNSSAPDPLTDDAFGCGAGSGANLPSQNLPCVADAEEFSAASARSHHQRGVGMLLADGAVRFMSDSVDLTNWRRLVSMSDGGAVTLE